MGQDRRRLTQGLGEAKAQGQWEMGVQRGNLAGYSTKQIWGTAELRLEKRE